MSFFKNENFEKYEDCHVATASMAGGPESHKYVLENLLQR